MITRERMFNFHERPDLALEGKKNGKVLTHVEG